MVNLVCVGSYVINGVVVFYIELLKKDILWDFVKFWFQKFFNKINGVIFCCWILFSNFELFVLVMEKIGDGWLKNLDEM